MLAQGALCSTRGSTQGTDESMASREEEDLYVLMQIHSIQDGLSTTDQDGQHQEVHCRCGEGLLKALRMLSLLCRCRGSIDFGPTPPCTFSACMFRLYPRAILLRSNSIDMHLRDARRVEW